MGCRGQGVTQTERVAPGSRQMVWLFGFWWVTHASWRDWHWLGRWCLGLSHIHALCAPDGRVCWGPTLLTILLSVALRTTVLSVVL